MGKDSRGYDPGKKINDHKRHLVVDTRGLPLMAMVPLADLHDSQAAKEVLFRLRPTHPGITTVRADRVYAGTLVTWAKRHQNLTIKTAGRPKGTYGFVLLPRRWVVERRHGSCTPAGTPGTTSGSWSTESLITCAVITLMTRRLTRKPTAGPCPGRRLRLTGDGDPQIPRRTVAVPDETGLAVRELLSLLITAWAREESERPSPSLRTVPALHR